MGKPAVYNEIDPYCCEVLRARIADRSLPPGDVDERDIREVKGDDYKGYGQIHLFAGIGGFGYAARLAGLPDGFGILTGGFPCQDISIAGKGEGIGGERSGLWSEQARLVGDLRPRLAFVENVSELLDRWLGVVLGSLAEIGYDAEWHCIPASSVGAIQERDRIWIVAYPVGTRRERLVESINFGEVGSRGLRGAEDLLNYDPFKPGDSWPQPLLRRMDDGLPRRVDRLRALGNAIVPAVAAEILKAMWEADHG